MEEDTVFNAISEAKIMAKDNLLTNYKESTSFQEKGKKDNS